MRIKSKFINRAGGLLIASTTRLWMRTLDHQIAFYDPTADPIHPDFRGPVIFLFWHEYIPVPFYLRGHSNIAMLLSQHQDAEWLSHAARLMGFETIRGSTNRGGVAALRQLLRTSHSMNLAITPDGPRGPRRRLAPGPIYLSARLGIPLIVFGVGCDRPWRMATWDRFALPRPYSRARIIVSPKVQIPSGLDREGVEGYRQHVEALLNDLTEQAETWAESGTRLQQQTPIRREGIPIVQRRAA
ncbi:MAG: hypothetical protein CMJ64_05225 [Planctomycetaceae bacterium]|nr:hypothetical protein [Planctomycetaceae bacterium]